MNENQACEIIPYYGSNGSQTSNHVKTCEFEEYTPVINGWLFYLHTGMIIIIVCPSAHNSPESHFNQFSFLKQFIITELKLGNTPISSDKCLLTYKW